MPNAKLVATSSGRRPPREFRNEAVAASATSDAMYVDEQPCGGPAFCKRDPPIHTCALTCVSVLSREGRESGETQRERREPLCGRSGRRADCCTGARPIPTWSSRRKRCPPPIPTFRRASSRRPLCTSEARFFPAVDCSGAHVLFAQKKTKLTRHVSPRYRYDRLRGSPREHPRPWRPDHVAAPTRSRLCSDRPQDAGGSVWSSVWFVFALFVRRSTHTRTSRIPPL